MEHGGDIYTEGLLKGRKILDFSSNINPVGLPKSFDESIKEAYESLERYPDVLYRSLKASIKEYIEFSGKYFFKTQKDIFIENTHIVLGNGAAEVIDLAVSCFKTICIAVPSFIEYEKNALKWGTVIHYSSLKQDMTYDYEDILKSMDKSEALIIGNPNNPNGGVIDKKEFIKVLDYCEENKKIIIVDEAFIEFTGKNGLSFLDLIDEYKCLFIIKALTKFFAMPGIRFGYGISKNEELIEKICNKQNPWNINCFAEAAAKHVLKDKDYIEKSLKWIEEERNFMMKELSKISFIDKVYKTHTNFVLCKLKNIDCHHLYEECMKRNLSIRKCGNFKGLDNSYVRFAVKDRKKNNILIKTLSLI